VKGLSVFGDGLQNPRDGPSVRGGDFHLDADCVQQHSLVHGYTRSTDEHRPLRARRTRHVSIQSRSSL